MCVYIYIYIYYVRVVAHHAGVQVLQVGARPRGFQEYCQKRLLNIPYYIVCQKRSTDSRVC